MKLIELLRNISDGNYRIGEKITSDEGICLEVKNNHHLIWYVRGEEIDAGEILALPGD